MEIINEIKLIPINQIKPYHRNVRKNDVTVSKLVDLIPKVGFNVPIVLDHNNVIIKGHSRWKAGIRLRLEKLPCVYSNASEESIKLDRLSDNKVQEFSQWDDELLKSELVSLNLDFAFDLSDLGFKLDLQPFSVNETPLYQPVYQNNPTSQNMDNQSYVHQTQQYEHNYETKVDEEIQYQEPSQPFITNEDVAKTVPYNIADYKKCICDQCGNVMFIRKD